MTGPSPLPTTAPSPAPAASDDPRSPAVPQVVIVGGGFGGLYAAKALGRAPVRVTLVDRRNFHLFQPLLYQVATGSVSPADIASPLRAIVGRNANTTVLLAAAVDLDPDRQILRLDDGRELAYDTLILAAGVSHHYFGNDRWQAFAPGLKTVEDALEMRRRIFLAFEAAEKELDPDRRRAWLTFAIVGGGPTGVELAGAIAEIARGTLRRDFRHIDPTEARILLVEGLDRLLPPYDPALSARARADLERLGVVVRVGTRVTDLNENGVVLQGDEGTEWIPAKTILWAAGVRASPLGQVLAERTGVALDRAGRAIVAPDLSLPGYPNLMVVGDLAHFAHGEPTADGEPPRPLPGIAPVAMQQGEYAARRVRLRLRGETPPPFRYADRGNLAVIGQNAAVVDLGFVKLVGPIAWLAWVFAHIYFLIEFDNKLVVMVQWGWSYFTRGRGARLITGPRAIAAAVPPEAPEASEPSAAPPAPELAELPPPQSPSVSAGESPA